MEHTKDFLNLLLDRRSCRAFQPDPVDRPTLAAIVEAGRYAPSAMNIQKNHFYIITDPALGSWTASGWEPSGEEASGWDWSGAEASG